MKPTCTHDKRKRSDATKGEITRLNTRVYQLL